MSAGYSTSGTTHFAVYLNISIPTLSCAVMTSKYVHVYDLTFLD